MYLLTDWKALTTNNRAMRVKEMGFTITKYLPLNEQTKQICGVTDIYTQVVADPELMVMTDTNRLTEELVETLKKDASINSVNDKFSNALPKTMAAGKLSRCKFNYGPELVNATTALMDDTDTGAKSLVLYS